MTRPTVSIVIPTYNRREVLHRAIHSVIEQSYFDWEIVLIDDGSTDRTDEMAADYAQLLGDRFVYLHQENSGCCSARNKGIEVSRGKFVAFLDSDDEFVPTKLQRQLELFRKIPTLGFVYSDFSYVDLDGQKHKSVFDTQCPLAREVKQTSVGENLCVCDDKLFDTLLQSYFIATIVGMVRREVLSDTIRFMPDPAYSEEWLFYLRVARACQTGFINEPLSIHHHLQGSEARTDSQRNTFRQYQLFQQMLKILKPLSSSQRRTIKHNLSTSAEQLGLNAYRLLSYKEASQYFLKSFLSAPHQRRLGYLIKSLGLWGLHKTPRKSPPNSVIQETLFPVR